MQKTSYELPPAIIEEVERLSTLTPERLVRDVREALVAAIGSIRPDNPHIGALSELLRGELDRAVAVNTLSSLVERSALTAAARPRTEGLLNRLDVHNAIVEAAFKRHQTCREHAAAQPRHVCAAEFEGRTYSFVADEIAKQPAERLVALCKEVLTEVIGTAPAGSLSELPQGLLEHAVLHACQRLSGL